MAALESVPNVSEGRDTAIVAAIGQAFASGGARLVDVHTDASHNRSVFTLVGDDRALEDGLVRGVAATRDLVDLRRHDGVHPRVGAADVVPVVPLRPADGARAEAVASAAAARIGVELGLAVFLYGTLADGVRPAFYRRGGPDELQRRIDAAELAPAFGPKRLDPRAGAVLVGVRAPLLAFNVLLDASHDVARKVASAVRASSGGLPGVQALGLRLDDGSVQVSTNIVDLDATDPHVLVERIREEVEARGGRIRESELVGLVPAASVAAAAEAVGVGRPLDERGLPTGAALAAAARALRLRRLAPDRVLEWQLRH
jgi:glutamate formiminotransferase / 5-formyltetrahydrofolate cyclo-ligase